MRFLHDSDECRIEPKLESRLLHTRNVKPLTPVVHSVSKKESYENMSLFVNGMKYKKRCWQKRGVLLLGLQTGCTKYSCFIFATRRTVEKPITFRSEGLASRIRLYSRKNLCYESSSVESRKAASSPTTHKFGSDELW